jgi:mRNA-degrading endonuclease YafQ of YafQ-DinJ toxin-antitoxin module
LQLFKRDPEDGQLRNHALGGIYTGYSSIDITGDYRAIFKVFKREAHFYKLGTHPELYGK